jgi:hypothetical protein
MHKYLGREGGRKEKETERKERTGNTYCLQGPSDELGTNVRGKLSF